MGTKCEHMKEKEIFTLTNINLKHDWQNQNNCLTAFSTVLELGHYLWHHASRLSSYGGEGDNVFTTTYSMFS